jgi:hypothetical protein
MFLLLFAIAYRLSLKSSAILLSPLLWITVPLISRRTASRIFTRIRGRFIFRLARWHVTIIACLITAKFAFVACGYRFVFLIDDENPVSTFLFSVIQPFAILPIRLEQVGLR